jgi:hypothetical protein
MPVSNRRRVADPAEAAVTPGSWRRIASNLLPGVLLPGLIYFIVARHAPLLIALAAAASVPLLDSVARVLRGRPPSSYGLVFLVVTGISVGLAIWLHSPMFILAKGAVVTGLMGLAFLVSAAVRRPLTGTLALLLAEDCRHARRRRAQAWAHPKVTMVFRALAVGWAALLLGSAAQQVALILTVSPGTVMAVEPPAQAFLTIAGIVLSIRYVRRAQHRHAEVRLLPARSDRG